MINPAEVFVLRRENQYLKTHNTLLKQWHLTQKGKIDKLEEENRKLRKENNKLKEQEKELQEELQKIKKQRDTYKGMIFKPRVVQNQEIKTGKGKLGGQLDHPGFSRKVPEKVDQRVRVFLKACPNCQGKLKRSDTTKTHLGKDYGKLLKAIRSSPVKHADETGWRIKGLNGFLWAFLTQMEVYYTIEETRGGGVAKEALAGSSKDDVLVRDDYAGYKALSLKQQSCWAHLLRRSKEEKNQPKSSKEVNNLHFTLKNMYQDLLRITNQPFDQKDRQIHYQNYSLKLQKLMTIKFRAKDAKRIQTRIKNQGNNLLTALLHEGVPLTNNLAERQIRPAVVIRKISGGSRSAEGAETFATNFSVIQTIRMRHQPLIPTLKELILQG